MRNGWKTVHLGECVTMLAGGTPSKSNRAFWSGDIPWVSCKDMKVERIFDTEDHLSEDAVEKGSRIAMAGTVLIVVRGMILAKQFPVALTGRAVAFNQDLKALKCAPCISDKFLFYWLKAKTHDILGIADEAAHGTKRLQTDRLQRLEISIPPRDVQAAIVAVLSAYDDLIENNTRRIKILEEMAQVLYREWFVHFRFPGHEKVRMVESEMGMMPEGWAVVSFDRIADILSGGTPRTTESAYWDGPIPFFGPTDAPDAYYVTSTTKRITELGLGKCNSKLYPAETVFITARGTVGKVVLAACSMAMNQSCYALRGKAGINQLALFLTSRWCAERLRKKAHGAVFDTITVDTFHNLMVTRPPDALLSELESVVRPIFQLILNLLRRNTVLRHTRDLLLPKLISGEIPVDAIGEMGVTEGEVLAEHDSDQAKRLITRAGGKRENRGSSIKRSGGRGRLTEAKKGRSKA